MASNKTAPCGLLGRFLAAHAPHMLSPGLVVSAGQAATETQAERRSLLVRVLSPGLAESAARAELRASLAAIVDRHGDRARIACDRVADALDAPPDLRIVQAANDDAEPVSELPELCRCPACEGCDDRGEGDA